MKKLIKISAKGIAKFMNSTGSQQLKILHDYKYPNPEGNAMASYYAIALNVIKAYHRNDNDEDLIRKEISNLKVEKDSESNKSRIIKLRSNISLLESYKVHFKEKRYRILTMLSSRVEIEGVSLSITSDMHAFEKSSEKFIKYICNKKTSELELKIISQVILESMELSKVNIPSNNIELIDIHRGTIYKLARNRTRLRNDLVAACKIINILWDQIEE
ncbi:MAG: hypothetical protein JST55_13795 [Bacteroidetes bacterium]|nr:hypothetical protein [Bacteroidota bacterium]